MRTFDLGEVIADRCFTFEAHAGWSREVWVRLGRPVADPQETDGPWLCPYQVTGLDRERVKAIFGIDAMQALILAVHTIPAELAALMRNPGGRFLHLGSVETSFLRACRSSVDVVGDIFLEEVESPTQLKRSALAQFFLNVDLDVETDVNPAALVQALAPDAYSLERPPGRASFELGLPVAPSTPDPLIREFVRLVKQLPPDAREIWERASRRVFDIGIQSRRRPFSETHSIAVETLRDAAEVGAEIAFTAYSLAVDDEDVAG
jgi:uncharacterized protein DUF6968